MKSSRIGIIAAMIGLVVGMSGTATAGVPRSSFYSKKPKRNSITAVRSREMSKEHTAWNKEVDDKKQAKLRIKLDKEYAARLEAKAVKLEIANATSLITNHPLIQE